MSPKDVGTVIDLPPVDVDTRAGLNGPVRLDFPKAMQALIRGQRITRLEWNNPDCYVDIADEFLIIRQADGTVNKLLLRVADMFADDWIAMERDA